MKGKVSVSVFDQDVDVEVLSGSLQHCLDFWKEKFDLIPQEYLSSAHVSCQIPEYEYASSVYVRVGYFRPQTVEEKQKEEIRAQENQQRVKQVELEQLAKLKAKYPDSC